MKVRIFTRRFWRAVAQAILCYGFELHDVVEYEDEFLGRTQLIRYCRRCGLELESGKPLLI